MFPEQWQNDPPLLWKRQEMPSQAAAPHSKTKKIGLKTLWDWTRFRGISMRVVKVVTESTDRTIQRRCLRVFGAFPGAALHRNNPNQRVARTHAGAALYMDGKQRPIVAEPCETFCHFKEGVFPGHWSYRYVHVYVWHTDKRFRPVRYCWSGTVSNTRSSDALGHRLTRSLVSKQNIPGYSKLQHVHVSSGRWKHAYHTWVTLEIRRQRIQIYSHCCGCNIYFFQ